MSEKESARVSGTTRGFMSRVLFIISVIKKAGFRSSDLNPKSK